ncbi:MAG: hypothetical protein KTR31_30595 [Myxococcales bacterium]|nr:hypothetical protein [Myxococcales bacterium]
MWMLVALTWIGCGGDPPLAAADLDLDPVAVVPIGRSAERAACLAKPRGPVRLRGRIGRQDEGVSTALSMLVDPDLTRWEVVGHSDRDGIFDISVEGPALVAFRSVKTSGWDDCVWAGADAYREVEAYRARRRIVEVVDVHGEPVADVTLLDKATVLGVTGPDGRLRSDSDRVAAELHVRHPRFLEEQVDVVERPGEEATLTRVVVAERKTLMGRVIAADTGRPIAGAEVRSHPWTAWTDADGTYELAVDGWWPMGSVLWVEAVSAGYQKQSWNHFLGLVWRSDGLAHPATETQLDFVLSPTRPVVVRCAGVDDEQCLSVVVSCRTVEGGSVDAGVHDSWRHRTEPNTVACAAGVPAVVEGAGQAVWVPADVDVAWLDLRGIEGGVRALLPDDLRCGNVYLRLQRTSALDRYVGRRWSCEGDAAVRAEGLVDGRWELEVRGRSGEERRVTTAVAEVRGSVVDLGVLTDWRTR